MTYIATFDAGTTAVKGVLVDGRGRAALTRSVEIPTLFDGWRKEQDPAAWWAAFASISKEFTAQAGGAEIAAVVMSGQMQDLIPLDEALRPVCNAILYSDGRAAAQARRLEEAVGAERFLQITGNRCDGTLPLPKLLWLKENRPELYARTAQVLISSKDYLIARLTGVCCGDVTACSTAGAMDIRRKCWSETLLSAAGVSQTLFPPLYQPHRQAGVVTEGSCGYRPGTPVFAGIGDVGATSLASGIARPGQVNINLGTSGWVAAMSEDVLEGEAGVFNLAAAEEGCYINVVPFLNGGNVHRWVAGVLKNGDYAALTALLEAGEPGGHGTLFLPYLAGERFPVPDPGARGCFVGLTAETSAADMARACLEGVAFSLRQGLERLSQTPVSLSLIGGGGRETVWCQILADVLDREISVFQGGDILPAQAVAAIALRGLGALGAYEDFTASIQTPSNRVLYKPRREYRALYDGMYRRFLMLYPALRDCFPPVRDIR